MVTASVELPGVMGTCMSGLGGRSCDVLHLCVPQISKQQLQTVKERFQSFLGGETQIVADEAFINAVQSYYDVSFLFWSSD